MDKLIKKEIGNRIRTMREDRGYSRKKLSSLAKIPSKSLYEIEKGKRGFSIETLLKLCNSLGATCGYILGENRNQEEIQETYCLLKRFDSIQIEKVKVIIKNLYKLTTIKIMK